MKKLKIIDQDLLLCFGLWLLSTIGNYYFLIFFDFGAVASYLFTGILVYWLLPENWNNWQRWLTAALIYLSNAMAFLDFSKSYWLNHNVWAIIPQTTHLLLLSFFYWLGWKLVDFLNVLEDD